MIRGRTIKYRCLLLPLALGALHVWSAIPSDAGTPSVPEVHVVTPVEGAGPGRVVEVAGEGCHFGGSPAEVASVKLFLSAILNPGVTSGFIIYTDLTVNADGTFEGEVPVPADAPPGLYPLSVACIYGDFFVGSPDVEYQVVDVPPPTLDAPMRALPGQTISVSGSGCVIDDVPLDAVRVRLYDTPIDRLVDPNSTRIKTGGGTAVTEVSAAVTADGLWATAIVIPESLQVDAGRIEAHCEGEPGALQVSADLAVVQTPPPEPVQATTTTLSVAPAASPRFTG